MKTKSPERKPKQPPTKPPLPTTGWKLVAYGDMNEVDPLGIEDVRCHRCSQPLRFYNVIVHDWHDDVIVGDGCCERMTANE